MTFDLSHYVCREAFLTFYGISHYQYYTALNSITTGQELCQEHGNRERVYNAIKQQECAAFLTRLCQELAESLPTGFKLELT